MVKLSVRLKSALRKIHLILALAAAAPLIVLAITGALLVFPHWLQDATSPVNYRVPSQEEKASLNDLVASMNAALPADDPANRIVFPERDDWVITATTKGGRSIVIDPYTTKVLEVSERENSVYSFLVRLHVSLLCGTQGTWITGFAALALCLLSFTGIALWWPVGRWNLSHFRVSRRHGPKRFNYDLHRAGGLYTSLVLFLLGITGVAMVFYQQVEPIVFLVTGSTGLPEEPKKVAVPTHATRITPEQAVAAAQQVMPEGKLYRLYYPAEETAPYRVFLNPPESFQARYDEARFVVDSYSGEILHENSARTRSHGEAVMMWILPLHFGTFGGLATQCIYLVCTLMPVLLTYTGLKLYFGRRRKQNHVRQLVVAAESEKRPVAT